MLRDDGQAYADALAAAGVPVTYRCYDDMMHGFHAMLVLDDAAAAADAIAVQMGRMLVDEATTGAVAVAVSVDGASS